MFDELKGKYPKITVAPDEFRAEMIGRQKALTPDGGADLGALRHRTIAHFAAEAGYEDATAVADAVMIAFLVGEVNGVYSQTRGRRRRRRRSS